MLQSPGPGELGGRAPSRRGDEHAPSPIADSVTEHAPVDPATRAAIADIARAAQTHIASATGLSHALGVPVDIVDRAEWAHRTLDGLEPVVKALAEAISPPSRARSTSATPPPELAGTPFAAFGPEIASALAPMAIGWMAGSLAGLLAQFALGQYDLPLPLAGEPRLAFVASNIEAFGNDWSLTTDDLRFALALREVVHGAQRSIPWVRDRLVRLSSAYVGGYELRLEALAEQFESFADFDMTRPAVVREHRAPRSGSVARHDADARRSNRSSRSSSGSPRCSRATPTPSSTPSVNRSSRRSCRSRRHCVATASTGARRRWSSTACSGSSRARSLRTGPRLLPRRRRTGRPARTRPVVGVGGDAADAQRARPRPASGSRGSSSAECLEEPRTR